MSENKHSKIILSVRDEDIDMRLDRFIRQSYPHLNQGMLEKLLRKGAIKLDQSKAKSSQRVQPGQEVMILATSLVSTENQSETRKPQEKPVNSKILANLKENIIFEDQALIVINKPSGLAVQGGSNIKHSIDDMLQYLSEKPDDQLKLVHRLDKETSGLLIIAKTRQVAAALAELFKHKKINKTYLALVRGKPEQRQGKLVSQLEDTESENGKCKEAISHYQIIDSAGHDVSLLEMSPLTGRKHQLRIHCKMLGNPIIGDDKYGDRECHLSGVRKKLHLHAFRLKIDNLLGKNYDFTAPLPAYFREALSYLGLTQK